jgi:hypothetical protein
MVARDVGSRSTGMANGGDRSRRQAVTRGLRSVERRDHRLLGVERGPTRRPPASSSVGLLAQHPPQLVDGRPHELVVRLQREGEPELDWLTFILGRRSARLDPALADPA